MGTNEENGGEYKRCDNRMLSFMAGLRWEDRITNEELAERCGVKRLENRMRLQRLTEMVWTRGKEGGGGGR